MDQNEPGGGTKSLVVDNHTPEVHAGTEANLGGNMQVQVENLQPLSRTMCNSRKWGENDREYRNILEVEEARNAT